MGGMGVFGGGTWEGTVFRFKAWSSLSFLFFLEDYYSLSLFLFFWPPFKRDTVVSARGGVG